MFAGWIDTFFGAILGAAAAVAVMLLIGRSKRSGVETASPAAEPGSYLSADDRRAMLALLQQISGWTNEYSGTISTYQKRLGNLFMQFRQDDTPSAEGVTPRVAELLSEFMRNNARLQDRLDAAEQQLDQQTRQLESYLTEARTDGLTGLANRRAFDATIDELFSAYRRGGRSFVLAMLDIDHFKKINDTYGHQAGDDVLTFVAEALRDEFADVYLVARYGGEEFALIMPGPLRTAAERIDALRRRLSTEKIFAAGRNLSVTVSCGVSEPRDEAAASWLIRRADEALYAAKNMGRNRVYYHDGRHTALVGAPQLA